MKPFVYFMRRLYTYTGNILLLNFIGMVLISLLDGVGIFLLIPLISFTGILDMSTQDIPIISWMVDLFQRIPTSMSLSLILGIYVGITIVQGYIQRKQVILNGEIQQKFVHHLREETYKLLLQSRWELFTTMRKSDIIKLMTTEIGRVKSGTSMFLQFLTSLIFSSIQLVIAFLLSAKMTVFVMIFGIILLFFSRKFIKKSYHYGNESMKLSRIYSAGITDHFNGIKDIKSNTLEQTHVSWFRALCDRIENNSIEYLKLKTKSQFIYKIVSAILISVFIFTSITIFQEQTTQLMLIIVIFSRLWPTFSSIQANLEKLGSVVPAFEELLKVQSQCMQAKEINENDYKRINPFILKEGIECKNIYFKYRRNNKKFVLKDINMQIPSNQMTAIVGQSGAGKSTLVDLLMGLNQPESGSVRIDGKELTKDFLLSYRCSISYVPQDPFLFNASLRENLLLIEPNASEADIWEALEFSSAAEFVRELPSGLDTIIGDRGVRLSGGERQRIVLARAILRKPSILVLDEATSALDTENERKIKHALEKLKGTMTIIIIAHRLSTIRNADQVIVLEKGEIIQRGGYKQLANEEKSLFSNLLGEQVEIRAN
ncbi:ABC transporter ATP-binding protein [Ferdinandcohnia quinoae]|uniref:ABC transporter ATP-binding protein/permease n=1 Tax=Fredinandcohnia quinoae TaxID=2918902 RepID=A0AAW5E4G6_9BACI|nr:ABC transporter ATP-binding protein [Fredinandcohnia sp. SECRCQ15]MCH1624876.1 ABC transporter ATP-binding protein/permease [Fredinandcohnia sp. SECRCQ15]